MAIIDTRRSKRATGRTALLALTLAVAAIVAIFFYAYPERPTAVASPRLLVVSSYAIPEDKGIWLNGP